MATSVDEETYIVRIVTQDDEVKYDQNFSSKSKVVVDRWVEDILAGNTKLGIVKEARRVVAHRPPIAPSAWDQSVRKYGLIETFLLVEGLDKGGQFQRFHEIELKAHPAVDLMEPTYKDLLLEGDEQQIQYLQRKLIQTLLVLTKVGWPPKLKDPDEVYDARMDLLADYFEPFRK